MKNWSLRSARSPGTPLNLEKECDPQADPWSCAVVHCGSEQSKRPGAEASRRVHASELEKALGFAEGYSDRFDKVKLDGVEAHQGNRKSVLRFSISAFLMTFLLQSVTAASFRVQRMAPWELALTKALELCEVERIEKLRLGVSALLEIKVFKHRFNQL